MINAQNRVFLTVFSLLKIALKCVCSLDDQYITEQAEKHYRMSLSHKPAEFFVLSTILFLLYILGENPLSRLAEKES